MKRLCFGTLMHILYQARNQKVTNNLLCDAIFSSYSQTTNSFDSGFESIPRTRFVRIFSRFQRVSISSFRPAVKSKPFDR
ncbi:MAG TPA: hypothetical protein DIW15_05250 [Bavariicoccus seileri]|uniref:Uncharacterized protein n=1 Tax=Bavariicoccus seileri TaxID=549685 RepID=A0A3D4S5J4_9ENTE|nr:hypothetical protein [Bavariicoccus seileri]